MEVTEKRKGFTPSQDTIVVEPVMRARNSLITDPEHEAFFLFGTASITYCLPVDRQGNLLNPFESKEEQLWLEQALDLDLNHHKGKNNFWHDFRVRLGKDRRVLNLRNPKHYLEYLVLRANKLHIAPDGKSIGNKATYRYALVSQDFRTKESAQQVDLEMEAYIALGAMKEDTEAMTNFLKVYGKKVSPVSKRPFLVAEIKKIIETDISKFLEIIEDKENYELKLLIADAVECGALTKQGRKYFLPGGDELSGTGDSPTLANAVEYIKSPANQDILTTLKARVSAAKQ